MRSGLCLFNLNLILRDFTPNNSCSDIGNEVAAQTGVTESTIYNWETNCAGPELQFVPAIINFLGYAPSAPSWSFGQSLRAIRLALGLSQEQLAKRAGLNESTVSKWEREEHKPSSKKTTALNEILKSLP